MPRPDVLDIHNSYIPENSTAVMAARVRLGNGVLTTIELFTDEHRRVIDFRGLPEHLDQDFEIVVDKRLRDSTGSTVDHAAIERPENRIMFEFAIGARQRLWDGAWPDYRDETCDPTSRFYKYTG